jgi:protein O-GlcNAc transferase
MDYKITDSLHDPPGLNDRFYTESLIRLDPCAWCYRPDDNAPPVNDLPAKTNGFITFAALNRIVKASPQIRQLWSEILNALPNSRLKLLADHPQDSSLTTDHSPLPPSRLYFVGRCKRLAYLRQYHHCDIALDSFPYNGHTTTCDALFMGLPVISLVGQAHISRAGLSVLSAVGHPEFLARTPQEYIDKTLSLARDRPHLSHLRRSIRQDMQISPLCDERSFTRRLESALRQAWQSHCASSRPSQPKYKKNVRLLELFPNSCV